MDRLFEFISNHPVLVGTFLLLLALFIRNEMRRGGKTVTPQQLVDRVNRESAIVVDVRDRKEFEAGHIVNAINIPYASLQTRIDELRKFTEQPVIIACGMAQHSGAAGTMLRKQGFKDVSRLGGGMVEWRNQNLPVTRK